MAGRRDASASAWADPFARTAAHPTVHVPRPPGGLPWQYHDPHAPLQTHTHMLLI